MGGYIFGAGYFSDCPNPDGIRPENSNRYGQEKHPEGCQRNEEAASSANDRSYTRCKNDTLNIHHQRSYSLVPNRLISAAKRHEVSAILYAQCKDFIPEPFLADLKRYHSTVLYFYANRRKLTGRVEEALRGMEHFTIKGASIAEFYPCPAYRTMGDTDIVIHKEDRNEADRRLRGLGLKCVSSFDDREWQYYLHHMEFELHDRLVYNESVNTDAQEQYFNDCWKHVKDGKLDWEFHFMFLIFHLRKHFMNSGVGFRHFMDIAVLTSRGPKFDWSRIKEELVKIGLWPFTERIFALNQYWFGVPTPLPVSAFSDTFLSSATELILKNGVFGFDNENNAGNSAVNAIRDKNHSHSAMIKTAARKIFPAYETMIKVPQYSYLKGHPYLLRCLDAKSGPVACV